MPIRAAAHDLADLASPECVTGSIPYIGRWYIQAGFPLFAMVVVNQVADCDLLGGGGGDGRERTNIVILWLVQLTFIFGDYGSGSTSLSCTKYYQLGTPDPRPSTPTTTHIIPATP